MPSPPRQLPKHKRLSVRGHTPSKANAPAGEPPRGTSRPRTDRTASAGPSASPIRQEPEVDQAGIDTQLQEDPQADIETQLVDSPVRLEPPAADAHSGYSSSSSTVMEDAEEVCFYHSPNVSLTTFLTSTSTPSPHQRARMLSLTVQLRPRMVAAVPHLEAGGG